MVWETGEYFWFLVVEEYVANKEDENDTVRGFWLMKDVVVFPGVGAFI